MKIKINKIEYEVPQSYSEISLDQLEETFYIKLDKPVDYAIDIVSLITKIPKELFLESEPELFERVYQLMDWFFKPDTTKFNNVIEIEGEDYIFPESLSNITLGEWVDLDYVQTLKENRLSSVFGILLRKNGKKYNSKHFEKNRDFMKKQTADKFLPLLSFFLQRENALQNLIRCYSLAELQWDIQSQELLSSIESGVGTGLSRTLAKMMYLRLKKLRNKI